MINALGHTASDWIIDKEATAEEEGRRHKSCTVCGEIVEEENIDKLPAPIDSASATSSASTSASASVNTSASASASDSSSATTSTSSSTSASASSSAVSSSTATSSSSGAKDSSGTTSVSSAPVVSSATEQSSGEKKKGCFGSLEASAIGLMMAVLAASCFILRKRKE